jgi:hypothetical protein
MLHCQLLPDVLVRSCTIAPARYTVNVNLASCMECWPHAMLICRIATSKRRCWARLSYEGAQQLRPALGDVLHDVIRVHRQQLLERPVVLQWPAEGLYTSG